MIVEKVSATIRYSQDTGRGAWKVIELGAEGSVDAREQWQQAQSFLYAELGKQMKTLWNNGTSAEVNAHNRSESHVEPPAEPEPTHKRHQTTGAPPMRWPTPGEMAREARPGGPTRRQMGPGAGSSHDRGMALARLIKVIRPR